MEKKNILFTITTCGSVEYREYWLQADTPSRAASNQMEQKEVIPSTHPLRHLSDVLSVIPAGEHVGEGEWLQTSVDQVRFGGLLFILLCGKKSDASSAPKMHRSYLLITSAAFEGSDQGETWRRIPLQYCRTVSMAHFLSESQRIGAEPVLSLSCGHQPCHKYTSWWLSTRNRAKQRQRERGEDIT